MIRDYKGTTEGLGLIDYPSQEELLRLFYYNKETGELRNKINRGPAWVGELSGAYSTATGYVSVEIKAITYPVARLIYILVTGEPPTIIDHIDGDTANNRWENLRSVTSAQNSWNRGISSLNTSGVKGLSLCTDGRAKKYLAAVTCKGKRYAKYFLDRADAEDWLAETRATLHGEYACHG